ncbi:MAG: AAA family ATPase [Actinobacteria bacterium]|nr:AAA family ATPase [Actinomycetota bacterium]
MATPSPSSGNSDFRENLNIVWRRKWILFTCILLITAIAVIATIIFNTPSYQSSAELLQRRSGLDKVLLGSDVLQQSNFSPERNMQTAAELVKSPEVVSKVEERLGDELDGRNPALMISVSLIDKTDIMKLVATDGDPQVAADVANAFAVEYMAWRQKVDREVLSQARLPLEAQINSIPAEQRESSTTYRVLADKLETVKLLEAMQTGNLEMVKPATVSQTAIARNPVTVGVVAFFISIIVGVGLIFLIERLDTKIRSTDEITRRIDKPIISTIPRINSGYGSMVTLENPSGACSEAYRLLKTNLSYIEPDNDVKSIMITSPEPGEGKSTTIANLAITMARAGQRVIVMEADLRRPMLSHYLGLENSIGLTNAISGAFTLRETLQEIEAQDLIIRSTIGDQSSGSGMGVNSLNGVKPVYCVTSGPTPPNPGEMAASDRMAELIAEASDYADIVLVDAPPLGAVGDAASMATKVDGVLIVMKLAQTSRKSFGFIESFMETVPCNVLGLVVTNAGSSSAYEGSYYY